MPAFWVTGGNGRMGQALVAEIVAAKLNLGGVLLRPGHKMIGQAVAANVVYSEILAPIEPSVLIDFSLPEGTRQYISQALLHGVPLVIGTTGLTEQDKQLITHAADHIPIVWAPNTSLGIAVLNYFIEQLRTLPLKAEAAVQEVHHKHKRDKPSGTARQLLQRLQENPLVTVSDEVSATRVGEIIGEHTITLTLADERLELTHRAENRRLFALGALRAAHWVAEQSPGIYTMQDVLKGVKH